MSVRDAPARVRAGCAIPCPVRHGLFGVSGCFGFAALALALLVPLSVLAQPVAAPRDVEDATASAADELRRARNAFEYGDFQASVDVLTRLTQSGVLVLEQERVDAHRILGLSLFYLGRKDEAANAFFDLLKQNPDYQLDPFYVPPHAVAFFDDVKKESEPLLAPIRERRTRRILEQRAEEEARREAERLRREQLAKQTSPDEDGTFVVRLIERRVAQNSPLVAWMPFGLGQFQNGHPQLGTAFLATEAAAVAVSLLSFVAIEGLRDPETGKYSGPAYQLARQLDTAKWISAGIFYGLWLVGVIDANLRFVPSRVISEGPPDPGRPASPPPRADETATEAPRSPSPVTEKPRPAVAADAPGSSPGAREDAHETESPSTGTPAHRTSTPEAEP